MTPLKGGVHPIRTAACSHAAAGQLVAFGCSQPITLLLPTALFPVRLRHLTADRLQRLVEFAGKIGRIAASADQLDRLTTELRGRASVFRHL